MSDTDQTSESTESDQPTDTGESPNVRRMREQLEAQTAELSKLREVAKAAAFKDAGLDPTTGLGKATFRTYEGEIDAQQIAAYATEEYGWTPPEPQTVSDAQERITQVTAAGTSEADQSLVDKAAEAAGNGNWGQSGRVKDQALLAHLNLG